MSDEKEAFLKQIVADIENLLIEKYDGIQWFLVVSAPVSEIDSISIYAGNVCARCVSENIETWADNMGLPHLEVESNETKH